MAIVKREGGDFCDSPPTVVLNGPRILKLFKSLDKSICQRDTVKRAQECVGGSRELRTKKTKRRTVRKSLVHYRDKDVVIRAHSLEFSSSESGHFEYIVELRFK